MFRIKIGDTVQEIKNEYVLKQLRQFKGNFELGLYAEGFASAPLEIIVDESIVEQSGVIVDESEPSIVEQLLNKVNSIKYIKNDAFVLCYNL